MDASARSRTFFDTNVLVYAFDDSEPAKQQRAAELLVEFAGSIVLSSQVLGEFYWVTTRKMATPLAANAAREAVSRMSRLFIVPVDSDLVENAIRLGESASLAYWDALIVKAASTSGCHRLLTEDLNHGQVIDGVQIENPFLGL